mmetsp:Transcript_18183/g.39634  ORF Transcript_18183/g.39634 Transcript_18183/m.39634 type:complete len:455 (+) Transcript_18183:133-1497(+)
MCSESRTSKVEGASLSSRKLALLRIDSLNLEKEAIGNNSKSDSGGCVGGLANELNGILQDALLNSTGGDLLVLSRVLKIIENITITDKTLSEEIDTSEGFRDCLQKVIHLQQPDENENNPLKSMQALAITIENSLSKLETVDKMVPFTESQLKSRLPLVFGISRKNQQQSDLEIMIHQVTSEKETETHDTGYVMWPSAVILSHYIAENPSLILDYAGDDNRDVLELGAGCGLVGLTVAALVRYYNEEQHQIGHDEESKKDSNHDDSYINSSVIFTDYLPPILENIERNLWLNDFDKRNATVAALDFFDQPGNEDSKYDDSQANWIDMAGAKQPQVRLVLAADVLPYSNDAVNVANTIFAALIEGGKAIIVSAGENKRYGVGDFPEACRDAGLEISMARSTIVGLGDSSGEEGVKFEETFVENLEQTVGFYQDIGSDYLIFKIEKPLTSLQPRSC